MKVQGPVAVACKSIQRLPGTSCTTAAQACGQRRQRSHHGQEKDQRSTIKTEPVWLLRLRCVSYPQANVAQGCPASPIAMTNKTKIHPAIKEDDNTHERTSNTNQKSSIDAEPHPITGMVQGESVMCNMEPLLPST